MAKVNRFFYVKSPDSHVAHRFFAKRFIEGEPTQCGIRVQAGWRYWYAGKRPKDMDILMHCKRCDNTSDRSAKP